MNNYIFIITIFIVVLKIFASHYKLSNVIIYAIYGLRKSANVVKFTIYVFY